MDIDTKIARVKELIAKREELDAELQELLGGSVKERRAAKCSACGEPGHRASTCPSKQTEVVQWTRKPASAGFFSTKQLRAPIVVRRFCARVGHGQRRRR